MNLVTPNTPSKKDLNGNVLPILPAGRPSHAGSNGLAYVLIISCIAAIGGFLFGFDSGVINGAVDAISRTFGTKSAGTAFAVASVLLGCAGGAFFAGAMADYIGRRPTMLLTAAVFLVSALATGAAKSAGIFITARIASGLAIGAASVLAPMYISEVAPARIRGRLASLQQLAIVLGLFTAFLSNYLIAHAVGGASARFWLGETAWRWMFWMEILPSSAFLIGLLFIPESPRYLVAAGKKADARRIFARAGDDADAVLAKVEQSLAGEHRPRHSDLRDHKTGFLAPVVWTGIGLAAFQQLVGINIIFYYGSILWQAAGASEQGALLINVLTGAVNILATFLAIGLIDRVGRRPLLLAGSIGMTVTLLTMAAIFGFADTAADGKPVLGHVAALVGLSAANLYIVAFGVSWGPVMWVLLGEMFPNRLRGAALALSGATNWAANFAVTVSFLPLLKGAGLACAYGIYALAAALSLPFVWFLVRETKGKTLEEMS
jgi:SP family sugar:H+ symporter-like MFS transporter